MVSNIKLLYLSSAILALLLIPLAAPSQAIKANAGGYICGSVYGEDNILLAGADVIILNESYQAIDSTVTNENGHFELWLASGNYYVSSSLYNYCLEYYPDAYSISSARTITIYSDQVNYISFYLTVGGMMSGEINTGNNESTEFVVTAIKIDEPNIDWENSRSFIVSYNGDYCLDGLLPGYYKAFIGGEDYQTMFYDNSSTYEEAQIIEITAGQVNSGIDFALQQPGNGIISGRVINSDTNQPLEGVQISAYQWRFCETNPNMEIILTDENGEYRLDLTSGYYYVTAFVDENVRSDDGTMRLYYNDCYSQSLATMLYLGVDSTINDIDFNIDLSNYYNLNISGSLLDIDNNLPIEGVALSAIDYNSGRPVAVANSLVDGSFIINNLFSGDFIIEIDGASVIPSYWPDVFNWQQADIISLANVNQILNNGGAITQDYGAPGLSIAGYITNSDEVLADVHVYAENLDNGEIAYDLTDASGAYEITSGLYEGYYRVFADLYGWNIGYYGSSLYLNLENNPVAEGIDICLSLSTVDINDDSNDEALPSQNSLIGNYPNPFNNQTIILFNAGQAGNTTVEIFNIMGQLVNRIPIIAAPGVNSVTWTGKTLAGTDATSGIYFCRVADGSGIQKMVLLK